MATKLSPRPNASEKEHQDSFEIVLKKFKRASLAKEGHTFRCVYEKANLSHSVLKQTLNVDVIDDCKFLLKGKIDCKSCDYFNDYREDEEGPCDLEICGNCGDLLHINFVIRNDGRAVKANITIKIEKWNLSVKQIFNAATHHLDKGDMLRQTWQFTTSSTNGLTIYNGSLGPFYGGDFYAENGSLTFLCNIKVLETYGQETSKITKEFSGVFSKLSEQFSDANINPSTTNDPLIDVILCVGKDKVHCHKLVLSLTSKFFERMFATDMKESKNKEIVLGGIDLETLKSLITFMYTDAISNDKVDAKLLAAADMYEVMRLRGICIERLTKSICLDNVLEIWSTAYDNSIEELSHDALVFLSQNWKVLSEQYTAWKLAEKYPNLIFTISALLARK